MPKIRLLIDEIDSDTPHISFSGEDISMEILEDKILINIGGPGPSIEEKEKIFSQKEKLQDTFSDVNLILGTIISKTNRKIEKFDFSVRCRILTNVPSKTLEEFFIKEKALSGLKQYLKTNISGIGISQIEEGKNIDMDFSEGEKNRMNISFFEEYPSENISISFNNLMDDILKKVNKVYCAVEEE